MAPKIIISVKPDGKVTSEVVGVSGPQCAQLSEWVNNLGTVVEDKNTDDYYKPDGQDVTIQGYE